MSAELKVSDAVLTEAELQRVHAWWRAANYLVMEVIDRVPKLGYRAAHLRQLMRDKLTEHAQYITRRGEDLPEVRDWVWQDSDHGTDQS